MEELITRKELAERLKRNESYTYAMQRRGFRFVAGRTTMTAALNWLAKNGRPWANRMQSK